MLHKPSRRPHGRYLAFACALALPWCAGALHAQDVSELQSDDETIAEPENPRTAGKLLLTAGVSQIEGAAGGGLTPWALIGGYGERDQFGVNVYYTRVDVSDYSLDSYGALIGINDRVELSVSRQVFDTQSVGAALGLGQ